jgi:hypothetical protein
VHGCQGTPATAKTIGSTCHRALCSLIVWQEVCQARGHTCLSLAPRRMPDLHSPLDTTWELVCLTQVAQDAQLACNIQCDGG